jgi:hypothetical protein
VTGRSVVPGSRQTIKWWVPVNLWRRKHLLCTSAYGGTWELRADDATAELRRLVGAPPAVLVSRGTVTLDSPAMRIHVLTESYDLELSSSAPAGVTVAKNAEGLTEIRPFSGVVDVQVRSREGARELEFPVAFGNAIDGKAMIKNGDTLIADTTHDSLLMPNGTFRPGN